MIVGMSMAILTPEQSRAVLIFWSLALGSIVGSFLNVVIYRLPAGRSLVRPGSHCPACRHPIRWYDNVPVFGWILLRGRCRDCGARISVRYPLVEASTAVLFAVVFVREGLSLGANLPARPTAGFSDSLPGTWSPLEAGALVGFHLLLLSTMLCAVLIEWDGHRVPGALFWPAMVVGLLGPLAMPQLRPVPAGQLAGDLWGAVVDGLAGLAAGSALGMLARPVTGPGGQWGFAWLLAATGLFLGWQAAIVLGLVGLVGYLPVRGLKGIWPRLARVPATAPLAVATGVWLICWRSIHQITAGWVAGLG